MELAETDKAWAAGFIDGEGCLTISRQIRQGRPSPAYRLFVTVANTDRTPLEFFQSNYGGSIYSIHERRNDKRSLKWADAFDWYCPIGSAGRLLFDVLPYLRVKRPQALLLIEFINTKNGFARGPRQAGKHGGSSPLTEAEIAHRERLRVQIHGLNRKGQDARQGVTA